MSTMPVTWENPWAALLLLAIPLWFWRYQRQEKHFWQSAFYYSPLAVQEALGKAGSNRKRWLYPVWVIITILLMALTLARPVSIVEVPTSRINLMMVMDISLSMLADDIAPDRIEASKTAAAKFVSSLPSGVHVGLELFAGNNYVVQPPTDDHEAVVAYINSLDEKHLQMRTEIGSALKTAVDQLSLNAGVKGKTKPKQVIVLISDGDSQEGYPWTSAVSMARQNNIIVNAVGVGSTGEASIVYQGQRVPVFFNEGTLRQIASAGGGDYFRVATEGDFDSVYRQIRQQSIVMERRREELTWYVGITLCFWLLVGLFVPLVQGRFNR